MRKKSIIVVLFVFLAITLISIFYNKPKEEKKEDQKIEFNKLDAMVIKKENGNITVQNSNNIIYTFGMDDDDIKIGDIEEFEYDGNLDENKDLQDIQIKNYKKLEDYKDKNGILKVWLDNGIFKDYYKKAYEKLNDMTLDEKIAQILLVRYPDENQSEV